MKLQRFANFSSCVLLICFLWLIISLLRSSFHCCVSFFQAAYLIHLIAFHIFAVRSFLILLAFFLPSCCPMTTIRPFVSCILSWQFAQFTCPCLCLACAVMTPAFLGTVCFFVVFHRGIFAFIVFHCFFSVLCLHSAFSSFYLLLGFGNCFTAICSWCLVCCCICLAARYQ